MTASNFREYDFSTEKKIFANSQLGFLVDFLSSKIFLQDDIGWQDKEAWEPLVGFFLYLLF